MNNRLLKIFTVVYEKQNMTQASESLFISQPSVSQAIKELEDYYQTKLFERYPKKLHPTPEGKMLYDYSLQILGLYDEVHRELLSMDNKGSISVGANISTGTVLIKNYIDQFHQTYPHVKVRVFIAGSSRLSEMIYRNDIDLALMEDLFLQNRLIQIPFYSDRIVFFCSLDHPLANKRNLQITDLKDEDFLLRPKGVGVRDHFDYLMRLNNIEIEPFWESTSTRALINAAKAGYGIAVLPNLLVKQEIDEGNVAELDIKDESFRRTLNITYTKNKILNKWTRHFIEIVKSQASSTL